MEILAAFTIIIALVFVAVLFRSETPAPAAAWFVLSGIVFNFYAYFFFSAQANPAEQELISFGFSIICSGLMAFMLGVIAARSHVRAKNKRLYLHHHRPVTLGLATSLLATRQANRSLLVVSCVVLFPSWLYFALLGHVPLFEGLASVSQSGLDGLGELQTSRLSRDSYTGAASSRVPLQGLLELFRTVGTPFLLSLAIVQLRAGFSRSPRVLALILALGTALLAGQRWPLIYSVVAVLATFEFLRPFRLSVSRTKIAVIGASLGLVGLVVSILQKRTSEVFDSVGEAVRFGFENLLGRILIEQAQTPILGYARESFHGGELGGRSYSEALLAYLPGESATFPVEFHETIYGVTSGFTAAPDFFTEAYLNFHIIGLLVISFVWGIVATMIDVGNFQKDPLNNLALKAGAAALLASTVFTGPSFLLGGSLIAMVLVATLRLSRIRAVPDGFRRLSG